MAQTDTRFLGGEVLRQLRERAGESPEHLAILTNRTAQSVEDWERGRTRPPKRVLVQIAAHYGVDVERLGGDAA